MISTKLISGVPRNCPVLEVLAHSRGSDWQLFPHDESDSSLSYDNPVQTMMRCGRMYGVLINIAMIMWANIMLNDTRHRYFPFLFATFFSSGLSAKMLIQIPIKHQI